LVEEILLGFIRRIRSIHGIADTGDSALCRILHAEIVNLFYDFVLNLGGRSVIEVVEKGRESPFQLFDVRPPVFVFAEFHGIIRNLNLENTKKMRKFKRIN